MTRSLHRMLILPIALGLVACDNPVEHEDHPQGLVVVDAQGAEVARHTADGTTTGEITVGLDATQTFTVHALAEDGDQIVIDGDELTIELTDPQPGWTMTVQGTNQIVVGASAAGSTTLRVELSHNNHPEIAAVFDVTAS